MAIECRPMVYDSLILRNLSFVVAAVVVDDAAAVVDVLTSDFSSYWIRYVWRACQTIQSFPMNFERHENRREDWDLFAVAGWGGSWKRGRCQTGS